MTIEVIVSLIAALGVGGILGAILNRRYEQQKQSNEHDIKIFTQSNEVLTEQKLSDIAGNQLLGNHSIRDDDFHIIIRWCSFFEQIGNHYLDKILYKENLKLVSDLAKLTNFIAYNFFTIWGQNPNNNNQYLQPDLCPDRSRDSSPEKTAKYDEYVEELELLTKKALLQYSKYRLAIKRNLKI